LKPMPPAYPRSNLRIGDLLKGGMAGENKTCDKDMALPCPMC
jgi:hypothetical protein